ncbi:hypothetical protein [Acanthopleuribacter pedis]|uniref:Uncharacterized protein n=1 Tax=Acanthopleuribacter pedis TaxID=442870 RepID=A0A8J7QMG4_9BACT|nr:hypothetical protein [Acanthopleuribacter pedis]MBO1320695.1 hypothetical protein [Acanthopleuribacter pedis]
MESSGTLDKRKAAENFAKHGDAVGLTQERATGPRQGMWRANQPQIATFIQKPA